MPPLDSRKNLILFSLFKVIWMPSKLLYDQLAQLSLRVKHQPWHWWPSRVLKRRIVVFLKHVETLYASLNVHETFPELNRLSLDFVRMLFMAWDLKINIRKWAIASFFEWEKLNRAVGGKQNPLGKATNFVLDSQLIRCFIP
jgi:hypothetical protein